MDNEHLSSEPILSPVVTRSIGVSEKRLALRDFIGATGLLILLRIGLPFLPVPKGLAGIVDTIVIILVMTITIWSIFRMMSRNLSPKESLVLLIAGVAIHGLGIALNLTISSGPLLLIGAVLTQTGLPLWCIGLGALLASLLREKNILIPVAIFLIAWDIFLVLSPIGFTKQFMAAVPKALPQAGLVIPKSAPTGQKLATFTSAASAYVGPADLVFLGTFFLAMYRFGMKPEKTFRIMVPVLIAYLIGVLITGISLPALVPMGLVVLLVNKDEFKLSRDEWIATGVVAAAMSALLIYSFKNSKSSTLPESPTGPSRRASAPASGAPGGSRGPAILNRPPSKSPNVRKSTPSPQ